MICIWVFGVGDDVNFCFCMVLCKIFVGVILKIVMNGEILVLDLGGYGVVMIIKFIMIDGSKGVGFGLILVVSINGININIMDVVDIWKIVILCNLLINGGGNGLKGINILVVVKVIIVDS